jgi:hypothetical protein
MTSAQNRAPGSRTAPARGSRPAVTAPARWLAPISRALDAAAAPVPFFFRDDDAGWGDARLLALLDLFAARSTWVDLAVIPRELDAGLARELAAREGVGLHQHGLAHVNHEPVGRKCEFGPARGVARQRADIAEGRDRLRAMLGARLDPIFTPPWNRCTLETGRYLAQLGFRALSREARAEPLGVPGLLELPVCVDWVRLDPEDAARRIAERILTGRPVGVMLHHAVMDDASLARAGDLLALLAGHQSARRTAILAAT